MKKRNNKDLVVGDIIKWDTNFSIYVESITNGKIFFRFLKGWRKGQVDNHLIDDLRTDGKVIKSCKLLRILIDEKTN